MLADMSALPYREENEPSMGQKDYYEILGIPANSNIKKIKEAYRTLAFEYHPDRNKDNPVAADKMKRINEAYAVLSDYAKRSEYDTLRDQFGKSATGHYRQCHSEQDIFKGSDVHQIFEEMAKSFGFRGFDDIFKDFYGPGYRSFQFKHRGLNGWRSGGILFGGMPVSFRKVLFGGVHNVSKYLNNKIQSVRVPKNGKNLHDTICLQPEFARTGGPYPYLLKKQNKKLVVKVPPGVTEGQRIRLVGMGEDGKDGGAAGDLYLKIQLKKTFIQHIKNVVSAITFK
jgi:DnaJ-class molecular chaperone